MGGDRYRRGEWYCCAWLALSASSAGCVPGCCRTVANQQSPANQGLDLHSQARAFCGGGHRHRYAACGGRRRAAGRDQRQGGRHAISPKARAFKQGRSARQAQRSPICSATLHRAQITGVSSPCCANSASRNCSNKASRVRRNTTWRCNELDVQDAEIELTRGADREDRNPCAVRWRRRLALCQRRRFRQRGHTRRDAAAARRLKVDFAIPEKYAARIAPAAPIDVHRSRAASSLSPGEIYAFDPRIDTATAHGSDPRRLPEPERPLAARRLRECRAGAESASTNALLIPAVAVVPGLKEKNVFVVDDGKASGAPVETGTRLESTVQILSGLAAGDVVITSGLQQMRRRPVASSCCRGAYVTLAEFSIRRPVLTTRRSPLLDHARSGTISSRAARACANIRPSIRRRLSISTSYPGAAAEVVQAQITEPLEEAVNSVAGIRTLTSTSREGASQISAEFSLDTDLDTAASDVRDQLARAVRNLPPDVNPPDAQQGACRLAVRFSAWRCSSERAFAARAERLCRLAARAPANRSRHCRRRSASGKALRDAACGWIPEKLAAYRARRRWMSARR